MLRNREIARFSAGVLAISAAAVAAAYCFVGDAAAACVAATVILLTYVFAVFTHARYQELSLLSSKIDAILNGDRNLSFEGMQEGELSILANELDKMVSRLYLTTDQLERESASLADSLADISHQLKTPMTSMSIMCELMKTRVRESSNIDEDDARYLLGKLRSVQLLQERVRWLVSVLLKLARIDAGVVKLATQQVDAAVVVKEAAESLAIPFDLANVELVLNLEDGSSYIGDAAWSREAILNVMKNCMEHAGEGGCVEVSVSHDALACRICIQDTGPGISPEDLPHVFERFYRGEDSGEATATDPSGVGIGLSLAQSLVSAQGGAIKASNARDRDGAVLGARFDIVFFSVTV
ncbi:sensor histidine kinase [Collinsella tanakaei]|uniref:sensor histidine kinase n=1 Tax=Collinsella tanakaei TaxID=626935 RepID=UPI00241E1405|nr:HAMP domain-containing sensor histidine kinase [Collinsella tanakaei]